jgi:hypothetical protein
LQIDFLLSELKQFWKLYKLKNQFTITFRKRMMKQRTKGISLTHYKLKIFAAICTIGCFALTKLYASALVVTVQLFFVSWISLMVWSWRQ